jgi:hypothetical protein
MVSFIHTDPRMNWNEADLLPRQFIWPMQDGTVLKNHRACNWLQENPVYDPSKNMTTVKPGATIMLRISTNGHASGYNERASGHYKVCQECSSPDFDSEANGTRFTLLEMQALILLPAINSRTIE